MARYRGMLAVWWALAAALGPFASTFAATPLMLQVEVSHGLPPLHHSALSRVIAVHMAEAGLADWRFEPARGSGVPADRVEWSIKFNPYAGGAVRGFMHTLSHEQVGARPVTIEARLYLNGVYKTLVEQQATIRGGDDDPDLASAVISVTRNLLGPTGAYRAINMGKDRP
jgi:hypothetical protein